MKSIYDLLYCDGDMISSSKGRLFECPSGPQVVTRSDHMSLHYYKKDKRRRWKTTYKDSATSSLKLTSLKVKIFDDGSTKSVLEKRYLLSGD